MAVWPSVVFFLYFVKHNDSVLHIIRFVFPRWHATTLKKQWGLPGLSISIQAGLDKRQMWISKHWLCLVYKCRSEQILRSWEDIFPLLPQIYTGPYSDTCHKQRTFGSVGGRPVFVGTCRSGPRFMASARRRWVIKVYRWELLHWQILPEWKSKQWLHPDRIEDTVIHALHSNPPESAVLIWSFFSQHAFLSIPFLLTALCP